MVSFLLLEIYDLLKTIDKSFIKVKNDFLSNVCIRNEVICRHIAQVKRIFYIINKINEIKNNFYKLLIIEYIKA